MFCLVVLINIIGMDLALVLATDLFYYLLCPEAGYDVLPAQPGMPP